ncbi:uncharacterized protein EDB91DRAFT_834333 [Suillus paluster]|uniref:uncharacterized protein n=1 Tax=Suillus paluster TaxID=48578 RepID=UPI001B85D2FF|nr:uncharacterized protein EDB91DRAFT_834333 [Suillus paluster]KAG1749108.1 hypothetical protein EDB91DRAFT_834333 [Suillus paluster]
MREEVVDGGGGSPKKRLQGCGGVDLFKSCTEYVVLCYHSEIDRLSNGGTMKVPERIRYGSRKDLNHRSASIFRGHFSVQVCRPRAWFSLFLTAVEESLQDVVPASCSRCRHQPIHSTSTSSASTSRLPPIPTPMKQLAELAVTHTESRTSVQSPPYPSTTEPAHNDRRPRLDCCPPCERVHFGAALGGAPPVGVLPASHPLDGICPRKIIETHPSCKTLTLIRF